METAPRGPCDRKATGRSAAVWGSRVRTVDSDGAACETESLSGGRREGLWTDGQIGAASAARENVLRYFRSLHVNLLPTLDGAAV